MKPFLLVLSAPSGGGKSSIARNLLQGRDDLGYSVSATLGAVLSSTTQRTRVPRTRVRVGDYAFDNANYVYSDVGTGGGELPIDNDYSVLRRTFW